MVALVPTADARINGIRGKDLAKKSKLPNLHNKSLGGPAPPAPEAVVSTTKEALLATLATRPPATVLDKAAFATAIALINAALATGDVEEGLAVAIALAKAAEWAGDEEALAKAVVYVKAAEAALEKQAHTKLSRTLALSSPTS
jgi:hypothetical protein